MKRTIKVVGKNPDNDIKKLEIVLKIDTKYLSEGEVARKVSDLENKIIDLAREEFRYGDIKVL